MFSYIYNVVTTYTSPNTGVSRRLPLPARYVPLCPPHLHHRLPTHTHTHKYTHTHLLFLISIPFGRGEEDRRSATQDLPRRRQLLIHV